LGSDGSGPLGKEQLAPVSGNESSPGWREAIGRATIQRRPESLWRGMDSDFTVAPSRTNLEMAARQVAATFGSVIKS
jgi:hypothetical protein